MPQLPDSPSRVPRIFAGWRRHGWYSLLSVLLLLPCYWQPRIQAGDLSSHIYNSWLARLIESGRLDGLVILRQSTNVLFDLLLSGLYETVGAEAAQRIAVSLCVLVFFWGAFVFARVLSRRNPWSLAPCLAMLAYGWVFHMGLFNFYLSLGLCLWALALAWRPKTIAIIGAVALFAAAYTAHALPLAWAVCLLVYAWVARRVAPRHRVYLLAGCVLAIAGVRAALSARFVTRWSIQQVMAMSGADQVWVFDRKYYVVLMGLLLVWGALFLQVVKRCGGRRTVLGIPFQVCVASAAGVFLLPGTVLLPGFNHALAFISERMSLGVAVCVCATLAAARPRLLERGMIAAVGLTFFSFLYFDERALNRFEDRMQGVVAQLPPGSRVVGALTDPASRVEALTHMVDRTCMGHCFSYANYEASTAQFRIRSVRENGFVVHRYVDSWAMQTGTYVPRERDLPLFQLTIDKQGEIRVKPAEAGRLCEINLIPVLPGRS